MAALRPEGTSLKASSLTRFTSASELDSASFNRLGRNLPRYPSFESARFFFSVSGELGPAGDRQTTDSGPYLKLPRHQFTKFLRVHIHWRARREHGWQSCLVPFVQLQKRIVFFAGDMMRQRIWVLVQDGFPERDVARVEKCYWHG